MREQKQKNATRHEEHAARSTPFQAARHFKTTEATNPLTRHFAWHFATVLAV
jgi:hypothetical protein